MRRNRANCWRSTSTLMPLGGGGGSLAPPRLIGGAAPAASAARTPLPGAQHVAPRERASRGRRRGAAWAVDRGAAHTRHVMRAPSRGSAPTWAALALSATRRVAAAVRKVGATIFFSRRQAGDAARSAASSVQGAGVRVEVGGLQGDDGRRDRLEDCTTCLPARSRRAWQAQLDAGASAMCGEIRPLSRACRHCAAVRAHARL